MSYRPITDIIKHCNFCNKDLPIDNFNIDPHEKDGHRYQCKQCRSKRRKKLYSIGKPKLEAKFRGNKVCPKCNIEKTLSEFNKNKCRVRGVTPYCTDCNKKYLKFQRDTNLNYKISLNVRRRINALLSNDIKYSKALELLGCSTEELRIHLEKQFQQGMNWNNWNKEGWHIDHIIPCNRFDLTKLEEQKKCFHYTNLRPLWAKDNLSRPENKRRIK